jgi:hypothetical protein
VYEEKMKGFQMLLPVDWRAALKRFGRDKKQANER